LVVLLFWSCFAVGAKDQQHWAFVAPKRPFLPEAKGSVRTPVDRFILAKLEAAGFKQSPEADKRTLLRRITFDLTGLPPTSAEVEAFLSDRSANAFEKVVERLLASEHYGERWGRKWLDVARYSDAKGYVYGREERFFVHSWAYRDWVVRAFNDDLPYDRFLTLQIAADQFVPENSPDLAAMGFVTGGRRFIGVNREIIDDRIDVVTRGTMGLTVSCARCHDHKYDPIPIADYYSMYGVFEASLDRDVPLGPEPRSEEYVKLLAKFRETMKKRRDEGEERLRARVEDYLVAQLEMHKYPEEGFDQLLGKEDVIPHSVRRWRDYLARGKKTFDPIFSPWVALADLGEAEFETKAPIVLEELPKKELNPLVARAFESAPKSMRETAARYGKLFAEAPTAGVDGEALMKFLRDPNSPPTIPDIGIIHNEWFFPTTICEELWKLQGDVDRWLIKEGKTPHARALFDRVPEHPPRVFIRGNPARLGVEVERRLPRVVLGETPAFQHGSGRLELAQNIVRPDNPLTARVMVNRIWQEHFGIGLVKTASDFGLRAEAPSHPELLDWLATEFVNSGWSIKATHRLILLSATYRQAGGHSPERDPENRLLTHFPRQRLDFEQTRDAMLAVTGEMDSRVGGKSAELLANSNMRRTLYATVDRQFLPDTFRVFDFANPDIHTAQRHSTTIPQQALFFLNSEFSANRAKALSHGKEASSKERINHLYQKIYQRLPTDDEVHQALQFISVAEKELKILPPPPRPIGLDWKYGWGEYDEKEKKVKGFKALPHFNGKAWQGGEKFPDGDLGWLQLTPEGGHPGNDRKHAVVRRWTAPRDGLFTLTGELVHEPQEGDGVRAFIVCSRGGELKSATAHHSRTNMAIEKLELKKGDTVDFVVDIRDVLNSDQFLWAPSITLLESDKNWDAKKEFAGPPPAKFEPLEPWAQYAQALLLANEFSFID
jgi:hypothetical protein